MLSECGKGELAYELLFQQDYPSWLYQVTKGATTVWEHWDGIKEDGSFWSPDMNSFNHYAYGAIGEWLYRYVAGIGPDEAEPGFKVIHIKPQPGAVH
ncbi:Bacterial alpha-L-rhamnosidase [compost metagenome]